MLQKLKTKTEQAPCQENRITRITGTNSFVLIVTKVGKNALLKTSLGNYCRPLLTPKTDLNNNLVEVSREWVFSVQIQMSNLLRYIFSTFTIRISVTLHWHYMYVLGIPMEKTHLLLNKTTNMLNFDSTSSRRLDLCYYLLTVNYYTEIFRQCSMFNLRIVSPHNAFVL